jgi:hypothetical protein
MKLMYTEYNPEIEERSLPAAGSSPPSFEITSLLCSLHDVVQRAPWRKIVFAKTYLVARCLLRREEHGAQRPLQGFFAVIAVGNTSRLRRLPAAFHLAENSFSRSGSALPGLARDRSRAKLRLRGLVHRYC